VVGAMVSNRFKSFCLKPTSGAFDGTDIFMKNQKVSDSMGRNHSGLSRKVVGLLQLGRTGFDRNPFR